MTADALIHVTKGQRCLICLRVARPGQQIVKIRQHADSPLTGVIHARCEPPTLLPSVVIERGVATD